MTDRKVHPARLHQVPALLPKHLHLPGRRCFVFGASPTLCSASGVGPRVSSLAMGLVSNVAAYADDGRDRIKEGGRVKLAVYDLLGREIAILVDAEEAAGAHAVAWNASGMPSGTYWCQMTSGAGVQTRSMLLVNRTAGTVTQ